MPESKKKKSGPKMRRSWYVDADNDAYLCNLMDRYGFSKQAALNFALRQAKKNDPGK